MGTGFAVDFAPLPTTSAAVETGGVNDFWLTVSGTAGVTLLPLGCVGAAFGAVGSAVEGGSPVREAAGLGSVDIGCVTACGAGVVLVLGCFDPALLSTGSSEVG